MVREQLLCEQLQNPPKGNNTRSLVFSAIKSSSHASRCAQNPVECIDHHHNLPCPAIFFLHEFGMGFIDITTGTVTKQLVHPFSCALLSYGAHRKFGEHSRSLVIALSNSYALSVLSKFPACTITP